HNRLFQSYYVSKNADGLRGVITAYHKFDVAALGQYVDVIYGRLSNLMQVNLFFLEMYVVTLRASDKQQIFDELGHLLGTSNNRRQRFTVPRFFLRFAT